MDCFTEGVMLINTASDTWEIMFLNEAWTRLTGGCMRMCRGPGRS